MNFVEIIIGNETYRLKLTTRSLIQLERALGYNPIQLFMDIEDGQLPRLTDMAIILQSMLTTLNHGLSQDKVYDLIDTFLRDGHNMFDLIPIFVDVFKAAGFLSMDEESEEKNV